MTQFKDKGALLCAVVAVVLALGTWMRGDAARSQQLSDLAIQVGQLSQQVSHLQQEVDAYFQRHDGH